MRITNRDLEVLCVTSGLWAIYGRGPTVREVAQAMRITISPAHVHLQKLRKAGLIKWDAGKSGTLRVGEVR